MGWEDALLPPLSRLIEQYPDGPYLGRPLLFTKDRKDRKDLSPNHWEMGVSTQLLWAAAFGSPDEWVSAREVYLYLLDLHLNKIGLWTTEQFTGSPHGGFYLSSMFAARMAVRAVRESLSVNDKELDQNLNEYTLRVFRYMHAFATTNGEVIACGERMPKGPNASQASAIYRELTGIPHPDKRKLERQAAKSGDFFWLSLCAARKLVNDGDSLVSLMNEARKPENQASLPFTAHKVILEKWTGGHRAYYQGDDTCPWVWVDKGNLKFGSKGNKDFPELGPGKVTVLVTDFPKIPKIPKRMEPSTMTNLRGSIGPNGYKPPSTVSVVWRRPGEPDLVKTLRPHIPFTGGGNSSVYDRYGESDPECKGRQITAIGSEQLGGRAWLILKELYAQAGLTIIPRQIGEDTWDFAIAEGSGRPMDWCDYRRMTGKPDPICGENCPPCQGRDTGQVVNSGSPVNAPTNLKLEGKILSWDWQGDSKGVPIFTLYRRQEDGSLFTLGTTKKSPLVLQQEPENGTLLLLYTSMRKRATVESQYLVGKEVEVGVEPEPEPKPEPKPIDPPENPPIDLSSILVSGEIRLKVGSQERVFTLVEL